MVPRQQSGSCSVSNSLDSHDSELAITKSDSAQIKHHNHTCGALHLLNRKEVELKCGCKLPVIASSHQGGDVSRLPVIEGWIGQQRVSVLRDTGCSTVVVRESLVPKHQLTGDSIMCVLIDGTVRRTPVANIEIRTPYISGVVRAVCMKQPIYDVIIGNVKGVTDVVTPPKISNDATLSSQAVVTRQHAVQTKSCQTTVSAVDSRFGYSYWRHCQDAER